MGVSFSRVDPTQPEGERRAGRVVRVGVSSIVTECSGRSASAGRHRGRSRRSETGAGQAECAERDASGNGLDRIDRKDGDAGGASPLFPNVAETMARVLGAVKSREKKIGAN